MRQIEKLGKCNQVIIEDVKVKMPSSFRRNIGRKNEVAKIWNPKNRGRYKGGSHG